MSEYAVSSEIVDAGLVVVVEVVAEDLGPWVDDGSMLTRTGTVGLRVLEVLRGRSRTAVGETATVDIVDRTAAARRPGGYHGLWSQVPTSIGTRLVAFCDSASTDLAVALTEEHCTQLVEASTVLDDLHAAVALQRRHLVADPLLTAAERQRATGGAIFARYVWVATREALKASVERFETLMQIASSPQTSVAAQEAYLVSAYEDVTFTGDFPQEQRASLVRAMLRSALDPRLGELRGHLVSVYVPNLVRSQPLPAAVVFAADEQLREAVRDEVVDPLDPATTSPELARWLTSEVS